MADIWSTVLDGWTITINRNVRFQMKKFDLIKFKMAAFSAIIHFHMADIW